MLEMIKDFGMSEPGLNRLIRSGYDLLGFKHISQQVLKKSEHGLLERVIKRLRLLVKSLRL